MTFAHKVLISRPPMKKLLILGFILSFFSACVYENEEDLYRGSGCNTDNIRYSDNVNRILTDYGCVGCHNDMFSSGGVNLEEHAGVKLQVDNGRLMGSVRHEQGFAPMPQNQTKLRDCDIDKLQAWIDAGAPNN